ncbi:hypothetical protein OH146_09425 [Salinibacterium sp. SYSU T00001]|uniref:hypothetical protein n=1 Tax=Homoserinimonas sedimenticola TaxID=2986805 RepID=UPI002236BD23|nr:hypothetical protein [Salinibacterium sedimenticola]MCW4385990.1 hypothetical protein [Salinibacterium sedimenticola]
MAASVVDTVAASVIALEPVPLEVVSVALVAQPARAMPLARTKAVTQVAFLRRGRFEAVVFMSSIFITLCTLRGGTLRTLGRSYEKRKNASTWII